MSDVTNDEIREILEMIREKTNNDDIDDETVRKWSRDDIDKLLEITHREKNDIDLSPVDDEKSIYIAEDSFAQEPATEKFFENTDDAVDEDELKEEKTDDIKDKLHAILDGGESSEHKIKLPVDLGAKKEKIASFFKKTSQKAIGLFKSEKNEEDARYISSDEDDFDDDDELEENDEFDDDIKIADFDTDESEDEEVEDVSGAEQKTICIEKPGIVIKKGEIDADNELEGAPVILAAEDAVTHEDSDDLQSRFIEEKENGQTVLPGFESEELVENIPEQIDEDEAEQELFRKRKKKIDEFVLFGEDEDAYDSDNVNEKLAELLATHDDRPKRKETKKFEGIEYDQTKDARRVLRYLNSQKKKSFRRVVAQSVLLIISVITGISSSVDTTIAGDRFLTIFMNFLIIAGSIFVSNQIFIDSWEKLRNKHFSMNTVIAFSSLLCFVQTFLLMILYFANISPASVFGGAGVAMLLMGELNTFVTDSRTFDAVDLCSGENKDKLYSIEGISDDKDILELGKNVRQKSPRIRYSCKTRFPSHLVELCTSETSVDRRSIILLLVLAVMGIINFAVAWAVNRKFLVGFTAMTVTASICAPAYGALLIQLSLRWVNRIINRNGAMISCQDGVNELYRTNAIVLESKDLFDQKGCSMVGFKDFKNVRIDDAMLYAAAMVVRSGGPLTGVFDQMVVNRHDILPTVKSFAYEEKLGVSGWIYNQKVLLGNRLMMENHTVYIPSEVDEDKYLMRGHEVMYLSINNSLAAMIVVNYAPNMNIAPMLKRLRDSGVSILVRNCDPNVTERMISTCYNLRLNNLKILNSASGRVFKKYRSRPKVSTRAISVHDGSAYTFVNTLGTAASLHHTFKLADMLTYIGMAMGFAAVLVLSVLNVIADLPMIFVVLMQIFIYGIAIGITKITCGK